MPARPHNRILLGRITGAHGIRGDVIVQSFAAAPEDVGAYGPLWDDAGARAFELRVLRIAPKGAVIAHIAGVNDRAAAEELKGVELYVPRDTLPAAAEGEFYHADLIGLKVVTDNGAPLGEVVAVQNYGAGDLLEIHLDGSRSTTLVPFNDALVPTVDLIARRLVVILPRDVPDDA